MQQTLVQVNNLNKNFKFFPNLNIQGMTLLRGTTTTIDLHPAGETWNTHYIRAPTNSPCMTTFHRDDLAKLKSLRCSWEESRSQHGLLATPMPHVNDILPPNLLFTQHFICFVKEISKLGRCTRTNQHVVSTTQNMPSRSTHESFLNW
jgi:hypothetical protein